MSKLRRVLVTIPPHSEFERTLAHDLEISEGETRSHISWEMELRLPFVVYDDIVRMAADAGWQIEEFYTYLIVQGAMRVVEHGTPID